MGVLYTYIICDDVGRLELFILNLGNARACTRDKRESFSHVFHVHLNLMFNYRDQGEGRGQNDFLSSVNYDGNQKEVGECIYDL